MKYNIEVRAVALQEQSIEEKHARFLGRIEGLDAPWAPNKIVDAPDPGTGLVAVLRASKVFGKGVSGNLVYQFRRKFDDDASEDDYLDISFNPQKVPYNELIYSAFLKYVHAFDAYTANISDDEFIYMDFDKQRELGIGDRDGIYRVCPVNYWSKSLCHKAFKLSPSQIVQRLEGHVEIAEETLGGVFVVLTSEILSTSDMDIICWRAKDRLASESTAGIPRLYRRVRRFLRA